MNLSVQNENSLIFLGVTAIRAVGAKIRL